ncbi:MAG: LysR family transcriptional regulator [marine bacterium B5-7]|nr:MAG: LysR family transcriptional regulator [marine bacterium B5-7]
MNIRDLKYALAVAETRHFGRAAARCFVSQPTLSGQIKKLEQDLGVVLFERTRRSVDVTPVGEIILGHARKIIEQAELIEQLAQAHQDPLRGPLRIGAIPTLSPYLMPLILLPLKERYPQIRLVLSEELTDVLTMRLLRHEIDAALLATDTDSLEFDAIELFDEPFWVAHPRDHALYEKDDITLEDLDTDELLLLSEGHCLAGQIMEVCRIKARSNRGEVADINAASLETVLQLVGAGFGCTLVPALAVRGAWMTDSGVIARPLVPGKNSPLAMRRIRLVFRRSFPRREALDAFAEIILGKLPNTVRRVD